MNHGSAGNSEVTVDTHITDDHEVNICAGSRPLRVHVIDGTKLQNRSREHSNGASWNGEAGRGSVLLLAIAWRRRIGLTSRWRRRRIVTGLIRITRLLLLRIPLLRLGIVRLRLRLRIIGISLGRWLRIRL